jgi:N-dimethylarginine dimethylaminohydrolase
VPPKEPAVVHAADSPQTVLTIAHGAPHGGDGWVPRLGTTAEELGAIWADVGVTSEVGTLRSVLMRRPGREIELVEDPASALWFAKLDPERARAQHDALADLYRSYEVAVHYVEDAALDKPNAYFCRDQFAMTAYGAVLARPASASRAGEERAVAVALARAGVPILHSVHGAGTFEGADVVVVNEDLVLVGEGMRTNAAGAGQVAQIFRDCGVSQVEIVQLPYGTGHIDGNLNIVDRDLAVLFPTQIAYRVYELLRRHGFRILDIPDLDETLNGMAINMVPLAPGVVVMPAGNPRTEAALAAAGVECIPIDVSELMKGAGSVHCMTGVLKRDPL